jgi:CheY-like chemotaxis protein
MNGAEFRDELVKVPEWANIPIVVVSADAEARKKSEALGAAAFLKKPLKLDDLFGTVSRIVAGN